MAAAVLMGTLERSGFSESHKDNIPSALGDGEKEMEAPKSTGKPHRYVSTPTFGSGQPPKQWLREAAAVGLHGCVSCPLSTSF
jgi:hypothetical protein